MKYPTAHDWALDRWGENITDPEDLTRIEGLLTYQFAVLWSALVELFCAILGIGGGDDGTEATD